MQLALIDDCAVSRTAPVAASPWHAWLEGVQIRRVSSSNEWVKAVESVRQAGVCALDLETSGLDPLRDGICLAQVAVPAYGGVRRLVAEDGRNPEPSGSAAVYIVDLARLEAAGKREVLAELIGLLADAAVLKIGHNLKFDLSFLRMAAGRRVTVKRVFDTMLASQLCAAGDFVPGGQFDSWCAKAGIRCLRDRGKTRYLDQHGHELEFKKDAQKDIHPVWGSHSLQQVAHRHLEVYLEKEHQSSDWSGELSQDMLQYAARDAAVLLPLAEVLSKLLVFNGLVDAAKTEFGCLPAVVEIEMAGMPFSRNEAAGLLEQADLQATENAQALVRIAEGSGFRPRPKKAGEAQGFNPDSGVDSVDCLGHLGNREGVLKGQSFVFPDAVLPLDSRDETLLSMISRLPEGSLLKEFARRLRAYRGAKKKADFLRQWLEKIHPVTGRLHPDLRQINPFGVGRFSAQNPSLQQVPRGSDVRSLFKASEGRRLVVADYSGIEMRIMAQLSKDPGLMAAFIEGADIHRRTAAAVAGKAEEAVTKAERQAAKAYNFGLIYGMQGKTLQQYAETSYGVKMTLEEAESARESFFKAYPGVAKWHRCQERKMFESGFETFWRHDFERGFYSERRPCARTLGGRLRVWPVVSAQRRDGTGTYTRKAGSSTELFNTPDQGTGADMIKSAMALVYEELLARGRENVRMCGTVHDELILEAPADMADRACQLLEECMKAAARELMPDVPVEVEVKACTSWAEK